MYKSDGFMYDTPAAVDRQAHVLYINPRLYHALTEFQKKFVKQHEYGHYVLNTEDEFKADAYAFDKLAGTEYRSLKQCIGTLETVLDGDKAGHRARVEAMYRRALKWDREHPDKAKNTDKTIIYMTEFIKTQGTLDNAKMQTIFDGTKNNNNPQLLILMLLILIPTVVFMKKL